MKYSNIWRLLRILLILSRRNKIKAGEIAEEIEISIRQAYRDIDCLKLAGVPIYSDKSGYSISENFFAPNINFNISEILTIYLVLNSIKTQQGTPFYQFFKSAFDKIRGNIPSSLTDFITDEKPGFFIDFGLESRIDYREMDDIFFSANDACLKRKSILIDYFKPANKKETRRTIDPYGFKLWFGIWYLVGYCHLRKQVRTFRIDRIQNIEITSKTFNVMEGFDFEEFFKSSWGIGHGKNYKVKLRFSKKIEDFIKEIKWHPSQKFHHEKDGMLTGEFEVSGLEEIKIWIMGFGEDIEVIGPKELIESISQTIKIMSKNYLGG